MTTGTQYFNMLEPRVQNISTALDELNAVITGGSFDPVVVWPDTDIGSDADAQAITNHAASIKPALTALRVTDNLENAIDTLFKGADGSGAINTAVETATDAVQRFLEEAAQLSEELNTGGRLAAFNDLNTPADGTRADAPFGFIPAIEGVINAATNGNQVDLDNALGPLRAVAGAIESGGAYTIFAAYANASISMLGTALKLGGTIDVDDR